MFRAARLLVLILLAAAPAAADPGDLRDVLAAVRSQFEVRGVPRTAREKACWLEAWAVITELGLKPYLAEEGLKRVDLLPRITPLVEAMQPGLAAADPYEVINLWARSEGDRSSFERKLSRVWNRRRLEPPWGSPEVRESLDRVVSACQRLEAENCVASYSSRLGRAGWWVDITSSWYPFSREVHLFLVASSECSRSHNARTTTLRLKALVDVAVGESGERTYRVALDQVDLQLRCCETRFAGHWTEQVETPRGKLTLINSLALKIVGTRVSGRLLQGVMEGNPAQPPQGRIVYTLRGRLEGEHRVEGTFVARGDLEWFRWLQDSGEPGGRWSGRIDGRQAEGRLEIPGGPSLPWRATLVRRG